MKKRKPKPEEVMVSDLSQKALDRLADVEGAEAETRAKAWALAPPGTKYGEEG